MEWAITEKSEVNNVNDALQVCVKSSNLPGIRFLVDNNASLDKSLTELAIFEKESDAFFVLVSLGCPICDLPFKKASDNHLSSVVQFLIESEIQPTHDEVEDALSSESKCHKLILEHNQ